MKDAVLITRLLVLNDKHAFGLLVEKYQARVRTLFLKLTVGNSSLSDDLAQETFIKAYLKINTLNVGNNFGTWLYRIGYNVFLEYKRKGKIFEDIETVVHELNYSDDTEKKIDLQHAMSQLREEEQVCISLSLIDGFVHKDIAKITGYPVGTVKTHINRGRNKLKTILT